MAMLSQRPGVARGSTRRFCGNVCTAVCFIQEESCILRTALQSAVSAIIQPDQHPLELIRFVRASACALVPVTGCVGWRGAVPSWGSSRLIGASPETQQRRLSSEFTSRLGGPSRCPQSFQRPSRCTPHSLTLLRPLAQERAPTRSTRPVVALARLRRGRHVRRDVRPPPNSRPSLLTGLLLPTHLDASD